MMKAAYDSKKLIIKPLALKLIISLIVFLLAAAATSVAYFKISSKDTFSNIVNSSLKNEVAQFDSAINPATSLPAIAQESFVTLDTIAVHNTETDCWTIIDNKVYNVTEYVNFHPGGKQQILQACGVDATSLFHTKGGRGKDHLPSTTGLLANYYVANLGSPLAAAEATTNSTSLTIPEPTASDTNSPKDAPTNQPESNHVNNPSPVPTNPTHRTTPLNEDQSTTGNTNEVVALHNNSSDCWIIVNNKVYNVTQYIPFHPGGQQRIINYCGQEATQAFNTQGGGGRHSTNASNLLNNYYQGDLDTVSTGSTTPPVTPPPTTSPPPDQQTPESIILAQYPGAVITETNYEEDGRAEIKFDWNGQDYEAKFDSSGNLIEVDN